MLRAGVTQTVLVSCRLLRELTSSRRPKNSQTPGGGAEGKGKARREGQQHATTGNESGPGNAGSPKTPLAPWMWLVREEGAFLCVSLLYFL